MNSATKRILKASITVYNRSPKDKPKRIAFIQQKLIENAQGEKIGFQYAKDNVTAANIFLRLFKKEIQTMKKQEESIDHSARAHALLSASGASRWINCTPSARLEEKFENKNTSFSEEGTLAHEFAELNLKKQLKLITPKQYSTLVAPFLANEYYSPEMETEVQKHVDYVIQQFTAAKRVTKDALLLIEEKVDFSHLVEGGFGTCDDNIIADGVLEVIDLKYGKGVIVSAEDNSQLKLYAIGALRATELLYDIHTVRLTIVQPRLDSISSWEMSVDDLYKWGEEVVKVKAEKAYAGEGEQITGDWCRFCKAKAKCRALADESLEVAKHEFADPNLLSDSELLEVFKKSDLISSWLDSVTAHIFQSALEGKKWEGYKLVEGRSVRTWKDEEAIKERLRLDYDPTDYINEKLAGIGQIEKLVGKTNFTTLLGDLIIKPAGKPTLAPESDKRPELAQAKDDFA
jgi:hypothetical protein